MKYRVDKHKDTVSENLDADEVIFSMVSKNDMLMDSLLSEFLAVTITRQQ